MELILASNSPRRKQLLTEAGFDFEVIVSDYEEKGAGITPKAMVELYAKNKAQSVFDMLDENQKQNSVVLGADTVVVFNKKILGKPQSSHDAYDMLWALSGKTHTVLTGVCIITPTKTIVKTVKSRVTFNHLNDNIINDYIKTGSPMDKAGAYGIQDDAPLVKRYRGSLNNIIGLPVEKITPILKKVIVKSEE